MSRAFGGLERDQIVRELQELREDLRALTRRVDRLYEIIETRGPQPASNQSAISVSSFGLSGYIGQEPADSGPVELEEFVGGSEFSAGTVTAEEWARRENIAREVGIWLRRALLGAHRGNSGRSRIREGSNFYLVARDFSGTVTDNPIRVLTRFSEVKSLCNKRGSWGNSIFVGLPTLREVFAALEGGDFTAPPNLSYGSS